MVSPDGGDTWVLADGTKLNLPVTPDSDAFFRRTETSLKTVGIACDCQGNPWITVEAAEGKNIASGKFGTVSPPTIDEQGRLYVMAGIGGNVMLMHSKDQGETFQVVSVFPRDKKLPHVGFSPERPTGHHTVGIPWLLFSTGEKGPDCFGHGIFHQVRAVQMSLSVNQPH